MKNLTVKYLCSFTLIMMSCIGCVSESVEECPSYTTINYHYTLNTTGDNLLEEELDSIKVLIFDHQDTFFDYLYIDSPSPNTPTMITLPKGNYNLLTIGGEHLSYDIYDSLTGTVPVIGQSQLGDIKIALKVSSYSTPEFEPTALFLSPITPLSSEPLQVENIDIPLIKQIKEFELHVINAPEHYAILTLDHAVLNYDGSVDYSAPPVFYTEEGVVSGDTTSYYHILRRLYTTDTTSVITIEYPLSPTPPHRAPFTSTIIPLMESILANPNYKTQEDLDRESKFTVEVKYDPDGTIVEIVINGWVLRDVEPQT